MGLGFEAAYDFKLKTSYHHGQPPVNDFIRFVTLSANLMYDRKRQTANSWILNVILGLEIHEQSDFVKFDTGNRKCCRCSVENPREIIISLFMH